MGARAGWPTVGVAKQRRRGRSWCQRAAPRGGERACGNRAASGAPPTPARLPPTHTPPRRRNGHLANVDFRVADVTTLQLPAGSYDLIFSNWLLMYLSDDEVAALMANALNWVGWDLVVCSGLR
jgi:hypothetical protein